MIVKAHVLMGDDAVSKIGTEHASLICEPQKYLSDFGESNTLTDQAVEEYLVRVWAGAQSKPKSCTFDQL